MRYRALLATTVMLNLAGVADASAAGATVTAATGFESRYIFRGVQFAETSFQLGINIAANSFYGGIWANLPVGDDDLVVTPGGEELDFFAGYSRAVNALVTVDVGVTYYTFPDLASGFFDVFEEDGDGLGANTIEPYLGVSFDTFLTPSLYVYHDFMFDTTTFQAAASRSYPISQKLNFNLGAALGYVLDDDAGGDYLYGSVAADLNYTVGENAVLSAGARYGGSDISGGSFIDDSIAGTAKSGGLWWGVSLNATF